MKEHMTEYNIYIESNQNNSRRIESNGIEIINFLTLILDLFSAQTRARGTRLLTCTFYRLLETYLELVLLLKRYIFASFAASLPYPSYIAPLHKSISSPSYPNAVCFFTTIELKLSHSIQFAKAFFLNAVWMFC